MIELENEKITCNIMSAGIGSFWWGCENAHKFGFFTADIRRLT